ALQEPLALIAKGPARRNVRNIYRERLAIHGLKLSCLRSAGFSRQVFSPSFEQLAAHFCWDPSDVVLDKYLDRAPGPGNFPFWHSGRKAPSSPLGNSAHSDRGLA